MRIISILVSVSIMLLQTPFICNFTLLNTIPFQFGLNVVSELTLWGNTFLVEILKPHWNNSILTQWPMTLKRVKYVLCKAAVNSISSDIVNLSPSDSCSVFKKPVTTCQWDLVQPVDSPACVLVSMAFSFRFGRTWLWSDECQDPSSLYRHHLWW